MAATLLLGLLLSVLGIGGLGKRLRMPAGAWAPARWALIAGGLLLAGRQPGRAQDIIVRTDSTRVEVRVLGVKTTAISYQQWHDPSSAITVISPHYVRYIRYNNGTRQDFAPTVPEQQGAPKEQKSVNVGNNVVSMRPADLLFANATFTYERLFGATGKVGVKVPFTIKLSDERPATHYTWGYYQGNETFGTGLELNFYPGPRRRLRYFFGPAFQYGQFRYYSGEKYPGNFDFFGIAFGPAYQYEEAVGEHFALLLNNGVWYQVGKRFVFTGEGGIGWQTNVLDKNHRNLDTKELAGSHFKINVNFGFGYQF